MAQRSGGTSEARPPGVERFRRYRVVLRVRHGRTGEDLVVIVRARTQGVARREAARNNPSHVVASVERVD